MLAHIQRMIEELKIRIKQNVEIINNNQEEIKSILRQSDSELQTKQFDAYNQQNKKLLSQNNDLINVQLTLVNFLDKYKETAILKEGLQILDIYSITDEQEMLSLTTKGLIPFNNKHPHYRNARFIDMLITFYENEEDYEKCQELIKQKVKSLN